MGVECEIRANGILGNNDPQSSVHWSRIGYSPGHDARYPARNGGCKLYVCYTVFLCVFMEYMIMMVVKLSC